MVERTARIGFAALLSLAMLGAPQRTAAHADSSIDLPSGADRVLSLWREAPEDPDRRRGVARWAEARVGTAAFAEALLLRAEKSRDALDAFFAGQLYEEAGLRASAWPAYEAALSFDSRSPARLPLIELAVAAGWSTFAESLVDDSITLPLSTELALRANGALGGTSGARERLAASGRSVPEQSRLAFEVGLFRLAAELAESSGDALLAARARLASGETDRAIALVDEVTNLPADLALDFVRLTGDRRWLPARLSPRDRTQIEHSLEGRPEETSSTSDPPPPETSSPGENSSRERAAMEVLGEGEGDAAELRTQLEANGPPSLAVAAAWLRLEERERARREVARWQLEPRPGEEVWETSLRREAPEWFGGAIDPASVLARAEARTRVTTPESLKTDLERALLASGAGSPLEASLLAHRARLVSTGAARTRDLERAVRLAPGQGITLPHAAGRVTLPLTATLLDEEVRASVLPAARPLDGPWGVWNDEPWLPPSRAPRTIASDTHVVEWSELPERPAIDAPTSVASIAPVLGSMVGPTGTLWFGRGIAETDEDGALRFVVTTETDVDWSNPPATLSALLPGRVAKSLPTSKSPTIDLTTIPGAEKAWQGALRWRGLPLSTSPDAVIGSLNEDEAEPYLVIRGAGLRLVLARGAMPPPPDPEGFSILGVGGWSAGPPRIRPMPTDPPPLPPLPEGPWSSVERVSIAPSARGREELPARPIPESLGRETPSGHRTERFVFLDGWHLELSSDGWIAGVVDGRIESWFFLEPPLPGPGGWHFAPRPRNSTGRRGPDRAGNRGDAGTIAVRLASENRVAVITDAVTVFRKRPGQTKLSLPGESWLDVSITRSYAVGIGPTGEVVSGARLLGRVPGGFDLERIRHQIWCLAYDPLTVSLELHRCEFDGRWERRPLPDTLWLEEDRAGQIPVALGRWGDTLLLVERGRVWRWREGEEDWILFAKSADGSPPLPAHSWQAPPIATEEGLLVVWPWGTQERFAPR